MNLEVVFLPMENGDLDTGNIEGKNRVLVVNLWGGGRFMEEGYSG